MKTKMFFLAGICAALAACSSDSDDVSSFQFFQTG